MTRTSNGGTLSRLLWEARRDSRRVRVDDEDRPRDEASAYAVQRGVAEASGYEIVGFKIGATAQVAMDLLGVSGPFFGPLYREAFRRDGATVSLPIAHAPGIEAEFAVGLAADLPHRAEPWTKKEVEAAVAWVGPAFEIVGTRLESGLVGAGMLAIADGGANIDFVHGPPGAAWRDVDLTAHPVTRRINGVEVASGHSGMLVFGDPISGVAWLANHPELGTRGLRAGDRSGRLPGGPRRQGAGQAPACQTAFNLDLRSAARACRSISASHALRNVSAAADTIPGRSLMPSSSPRSVDGSTS